MSICVSSIFNLNIPNQTEQIFFFTKLHNCFVIYTQIMKNMQYLDHSNTLKVQHWYTITVGSFLLFLSIQSKAKIFTKVSNSDTHWLSPLRRVASSCVVSHEIYNLWWKLSMSGESIRSELFHRLQLMNSEKKTRKSISAPARFGHN